MIRIRRDTSAIVEKPTKILMFVWYISFGEKEGI